MGSPPYYYAPSMGAAIVFAVLFFAATTLHIYQMSKTKAWYLTAFCCGGICALSTLSVSPIGIANSWTVVVVEIIGYVARAASASEDGVPRYSMGPFITQIMMLLVAPALFAASIYMELGRLAETFEAEEYLLVRRRRLTGTFVCGDVIAFVAQLGGAGLMASSTSSVRDAGSNIAVAGLSVQVIFFACFALAAGLFHMRLRRVPTRKFLEHSSLCTRHLHVMYVTCILIFIRSVVRVVEFSQGFPGYIFSHQIFIYVFDAIPMFAVMLILNWVHPSDMKRATEGGTGIKWLRMVNYGN